MKINQAIHSSDDNPLYLDFWALTSKLWKLKFDVEPILLHFGNCTPSNEYGTVIKMETLSGYNVATQCQCSRYFYATLLKEDVGIISDIDMLPLSPFYYKEQIKDLADDRYIHLNPCFDTYPNIAACYHVAQGHTYNKVLGNYNTFHEYMEQSVQFNSSWFSDELYSTHKIKSHKDQSIFTYLPREGGQNGHRIDRPNWIYDESLILQNWYYDAHCPRPYQEHKESIDRIIELALCTI